MDENLLSFDEMCSLNAEWVDGIESLDFPGYINTSECFTESADAPKKKSVFKRIWDFIMRCFKAIGNYFKKFIDWIKSFFSGKKKTVDQILIDDVGIKPSEVKSLPKSNNYEGEEKKDKGAHTAKDSFNAENIVKPMFIKFREDGALILNFNKNLRLTDNFSAGWSYGAGTSLKGNSFISKQKIINLYGAVYGKELRKAINESLELLANTDDLNSVSDKKLDTLYKNLQSTYTIYNDELVFTLKELDEIQIWINDISKLLDKVNSKILDNKIENVKPRITDILNMVASDGLIYQYALNMLTSLISQAYNVDARFIDSIKSPDKLAVFADECIKGRIPQKYIIKAVHDVADSSLGAKDINDNIENSAHGATRVVLIPKGKTNVYKIATSIPGINANKVEYKVSEAVGNIKIDGSCRFAPVSKEYKDCVIIDMAYAKPAKGRIDSSEIADLKNKVNNALKERGMRYSITDIHSGNVGYINGNAVLIDYGDIAVA